MDEIKNLSKIEKEVYKSLLVSKKLKKDLMLELNLPKTSANRVLQNLLNKNFIIESGFDTSTGGRPPIIYAPSPHKFFIIGIDISRSYSEIVIIDSALNIIFKNKFDMCPLLTPEDTMEKLKNIILNAIKDLDIPTEKIIGVGLGVVEPINIKTGILGPITNSLNDKWIEFNIKELFQSNFRIPIFIDRGTNMAALGEFFMNSKKNINKIIYLNLGLGIRYGLVSNGNVLNSFNTTYDALGHMIIDLNGSQCQCGKKGCLELYGTISSIEDTFNKSNNTNLSIDEIIDLFRNNNKEAKASLDKCLLHLSIGINNLTNLINPDRCIINGPLIQKDSYIFEQIKENIKNFNKESKDIDVIYSTNSFFGKSTISIGAALSLLLNYIN